MPVAAVNGTSLHYRVGGEGVPIVFIHPPLLTSAVFAYQMAQLSADMKVITFDIRGHGRSPYSPAPVTFELIAEDIKQLLDYLEIEKAFICGYSTGGEIAMEAMLAYPDRFLGGILISAQSEASDVLLRGVIRLMSGMSGWRLSFPLLKFAISQGNADSKETQRNLWRDAKGGDIRNIHQYFKYSLNYTCTKRLSRLQTPVLLLYGDKDRAFKRYSALLLRELPHVELVMISKKKHQLPTKAPDSINETIRRWVGTVLPAGKEAVDREEERLPGIYPGDHADYAEQPRL